MTTNKEKTAIVYCRVSGEKQLEGTSLDSQEAECLRRADELGYKVAKVIKEQHSGDDFYERPLVMELRNEIRTGIYDAFLVYDIDRLSRNQAHQFRILEDCERYNTKFVTVKYDFDNSPTGKFMRMAMGFVAEVELEKIRERNMRGKKTKVLQGKLVNASDLYGYRTETITDGNGGKKKIRVIKEEEAEIVRRIFNEYVSGGSIRGIVRNLNEDEIPSPASGKRNFKNLEHYTHLARGGKTLWEKGSVTRFLKDQSYHGKTVAWKHEVVKGYENGKKFKRIKERDRSEWIELPDDITQPIINVEMFEAAQARLATNKGDDTRNETRPVLLRGLVVCAVCGRRMNPEREDGIRNVFRCPSRTLGKADRCGVKRINADNCEAAVWEKVAEIIRQPEIIAAELERQKKDGAGERQNLMDDVQSSKNLIQKIKNEIQIMVINSATQTGFILETFQTQIKLKGQQLERTMQGMAETESRLTAFDADLQGLTALTEYSKRVAGNLDSFGFDEKRLAMEALNVRVVGNGKDFRVNISLPVMFEKQELRTNHSDDWLARFR